MTLGLVNDENSDLGHDLDALRASRPNLGQFSGALLTMWLNGVDAEWENLPNVCEVLSTYRANPLI